MEAFDREFKTKGIFEVPFAKPGRELMLDGRVMDAFERTGVVPATEPSGEPGGRAGHFGYSRVASVGDGIKAR